MSEKILLVDGHSILNRAFYGLPLLTSADGLHTNAVLGFLNIILKILDEERPEYLTVAFDEHAPTFRHEMYPAYKGTRHAMPDELKEQVPVMKDVLQAMGVRIVSKPGIEADDIIGTISRRAAGMNINAVIVSGDRDLLQLVTDSTVKVRLPRTIKGVTTVEDFYSADVLEKYRVTPEGIIELKALMGDSSDNIPGVPKIGEKTATELIEKYGNIENLRQHLDEITKKSIKETLENNFDMAVLSKTLATINTDADFEYDIADARYGNLFTADAYAYFKKLGFKNLLKRFDLQTAESVDTKKEFNEVLDLGEAEEIFARACRLSGQENTAKAAKAARAAFSYSADAVSIVLSEDECYHIPVNGFVSVMYLKAHMMKLLESGQRVYYTFDLKNQISQMKVPDRGAVRDVLIGEYLIDPLRGDYDVPQDQDEAAYMAFVKGPDLDRKLEETGMNDLFENVEMPLVYVLRDMENEGIAVEKKELKEYGEELGKQITELEEQITQKAGEKFNINSPKQLGEVLFGKLGIAGGKKTKTGYSTAAEVLEKLAPEYPVIADILEYRALTKLKGTYADGLADFIDETGRIHSTFNQTVTATGRLSSADPNLQNIPVRSERGRELRKVFVPREGWTFTDADYSQIELRILASLSGDEKLIDAYRQNRDIHAITASQVFHVPFDEVTPQLRRNAKAVNFGIVYGISSFGLSQGLSITRKEAQKYIEGYFETYPDVKKYLDSLVASAKEKGYAQTYFGRRRPIPELKDANFMKRSFGERVAMNMPIQGTAADIMKIAMVDVAHELDNKGLKSRLILQVHDELLIETAPGEEDAVKSILSEKMMGAADLAVPLEIDINTGNNFYESK